MRSHHLRAAGGSSSSSGGGGYTGSIPINSTGLKIYLDANDSNSYSGSGTTWTNIAPSSTYGNASLKTGNGRSQYTSSNSATIPAYFTDLRAYINFSSRNVLVPFTYSVWIYPTSWGAYLIMIQQRAWVYSFEIHQSVVGNTITPQIGMWEPEFNPRYEDFTNSYSPYPTATLNNWYMVTMTYKNISNVNTRKIYINDYLLSTRSASNDLGGVFDDFSLGAMNVTSTSDGSYPYVGRIGAYMVYDRVLSATEITSNYNATKAQYGL